MKRWLLVVGVALMTTCGLVACQGAHSDAGPDATGRLKVVATTSIVGDVVKNVGGDAIELTVLLPPGTDPHAFEPSPRDLVAVSDADGVFASGVGLEAFLDRLLESAGAVDRVIEVSEGVELRAVGGPDDHADEHTGDPHTWTDPNNVIVWVHNIERALAALDPDDADVFAANADAYEATLRDLDAWVQAQVAQIPAPERRLVTDHQTFGYFADRYGFTQVGAIIPGYSTMAEPSAKELADLEDAIRELDVKAVFVGNTVNPSLARRVAEDTGMRLVFLYTGSLTEQGGEADSYVDYIRYNVRAIVENLK